MAAHELVVIGGSAGSLQPLTTLLGRLPASFTPPILVVVHSSSNSQGRLVHVLAREAGLRVALARDGQRIESGVFVAPPDHHLVIDDSRMCVVHGPKENSFRPAIDPLFRTAARAYTSRVIGIVLSGALDDGTYGLHEIKSRGGLTIVQDPNEAEIPCMPQSAMSLVDVDYILPAAAIGNLLLEQTRHR